MSLSAISGILTTMSTFTHPFFYRPAPTEHLVGELELGEPQLYQLVQSQQPEPTKPQTPHQVQFRSGVVRMQLSTRKHTSRSTAKHSPALNVQLLSSPASQRVMYLRETMLTSQLSDLIGLPIHSTLPNKKISLPGQLLLNGARTIMFSQAIADLLQTPAIRELLLAHDQSEIISVPVLREGVKYGIAEKLSSLFEYYCDEVVTDAHHVADVSVAGFGRRVEWGLFKDADMTQSERERIKVALVGDSTASGIVVLGILEKLQQRFPNLKYVELISPLATLFAAARITHYAPGNFQVRLHAFETLLDSQPPDYYWSPHFARPKFHIQPELQEEYRAWWGQDETGAWIADTACAGYGWSEAFFTPRKFIRMMNEQLTSRHGMTIAQIVSRRM